MKALLLSSSGYKDTGYLTHWRERLYEFVGFEKVLFLPFAGLRLSFSEYELKVQNALPELDISSIHHAKDAKSAIAKAEIIAIGGGNTFMLLHWLYKLDLLEIIKSRIQGGAKYFGWSAGANVAGASIMTTNDMPIIYPPSFKALNIFPHQINPHFISGKIPGHNGESREERLSEFLLANPKSLVYALPEGSGIELENQSAKVIGSLDILCFSHGQNPQQIKLGQSFKF